MFSGSVKVTRPRQRDTMFSYLPASLKTLSICLPMSTLEAAGHSNLNLTEPLIPRSSQVYRGNKPAM